VDVSAPLLSKHPGDSHIQPTYLAGAENLAEVLAREEKWDRSAALLERMQELTGDTTAAYHHALARLKAGDAVGYRRACAGLLRRVGEARLPPAAANSIAWTCAVGPAAVADYGPVIALAEQAVAAAPAKEKAGMLNTLGAVLYRAGRYQDAVARLNEAVAAQGGPGGIEDWLLLALAYHGLGKSAEAKKWLDRAGTTPPDRGGAKLWDHAEIELLRREAAALIEARKAEPGK
jgi:tetratricopeptide (TPR) repeat protein